MGEHVVRKMERENKMGTTEFKGRKWGNSERRDMFCTKSKEKVRGEDAQ